MPETLTTSAVILGRFYKEMVEEGVPEHVADVIVRDAAQELVHNDGIVVKA